VLALPYLFASDLDGDGDIYLVDTSGAVTNLTADFVPEWDPALSPSGDRVAYSGRVGGFSGIYVMDLRTRQATEVTHDIGYDYQPSWSPDGSQLAFVSESEDTRDIFTLDLVSGARRRLTSSGPLEAYASPEWSPDGKAIAYSATRKGVEEIYWLELGGQEHQVSKWPLKGRYPAWSPDGQRLAFAGWDEDDKPGIYVANKDGSDVRWLWEGRAPIRSLAWAGDCIMFSMAGVTGFDIYCLNVAAGTVTTLVSGPGWNDCPTARGEGTPHPVVLQGKEASSASSLPPVTGVNIADLSDAYLVHSLGFGWLKNYLSWAGVEPKEGQYNWQDPDNVVKAAARSGLKVLLRLHDTPAWARPAGSTVTMPPSDLGTYERFVRAVARRYRGKVAAYEIGNEPNLTYEWGGRAPDPAAYTALLRVAYRAIKAEDPGALVVSGGLATTGDGGEGAMGDLAFLRGMYAAGAKGFFDALGSHPYGYGLPPFASQPWGLAVSRLQDQHAVMEEAGDGATPIWATEVGWPIFSPWSMGEHDRYAVSEQLQAYYYRQLFLEAKDHWPWLQAIFLFNLDFSTVSWYDAKQPMRWYSILEPDGSPRLAFTWLCGLAGN
jgi:Tol biopolymer transport system component